MRPLVKKCDVLVVGGGASGIAAALAAARQGSQVILLEKYGFPGGLAVSGLVGTICGLYLRGDNKPRFAENCFAVEWAERLMSRIKTTPEQLPGGFWVLPYEPAQFVFLADEMLAECDNVETILHGVVGSVEVDQGKIENVYVLAWNRHIVIQPKAVVDCTGEATLIHLAGGEVSGEDETQMPAAIFDMLGVQADLHKQQTRLGVLRQISEAVERGLLVWECQGVSLVPTMRDLPGVARFKLSLHHSTGHSCNSISNLEMAGRRAIDSLAVFLQKNIPAFKNAQLRLPVQVGIRAGRRAEGRSRLTTADVLGCRKKDRNTPWGVWPVEIWKGGNRPEVRYLPEGDFYTIPKECQTAVNLHNVFMAGRCLSASSETIASARVIGTALQTGFAAGGYAAESGV